MGPASILKRQKEFLIPDKETKNYLAKKSKLIVSLIKEELTKQKIQATPFIGGSFAKGTLIKGETYDIDLFIRFDWRYKEISNLLGRIVGKVANRIKMKVKLLHGSRDYFQLAEDEKTIFEIIPVYQIKKPKEARNVTDLSYFHVSYVKRKLNSDSIRKEVLLAKRFCQAQRIYGAESYVNGFSGYGLECLIIHYKSFLNMLRRLTKIKDRALIDIEKHYKNESEALLSLNESRLHSPLILIDPTWKERNVLAALTKESFSHFQQSAKEFLAKPSDSFFEVKEFDENSLRKAANKNEETLHVKIKTDRQAGDIAGTKMKKFSEFLCNELRNYFEITNHQYIYSGTQESDFYAILKKKDKLIIIGPPKDMKPHARAFRNRHANVFEKSGRLYSEFKINFSAKQFIEKFAKEEKDKLKEMGIAYLRTL